MTVKLKGRSHPAMASRQEYHEKLAEQFAGEATDITKNDQQLGIIQPAASASASAPAPAAPAPEAPAAPAVTQPVFEFGAPAAPAAPATTATMEEEAAKRIAELEAKLQSTTAERDERNAELTAARAEAAELAELRQYRADAEMRARLQLDGVEFDNLQPEAAQEINEKVIMPALTAMQQTFDKQTQALQSKVEQTERELKERGERETEEQANRRIANINDKLESAHPGIGRVIGSAEFQEYLRQPSSEHATTTLGELVGMEYHKGNTPYVVSAVQNFLGGRPNINDVASAPTVTTANSPAVTDTTVDASQYTPDKLREMNLARQTGKVSGDEYKAWYAEYKKHKQS